MLKDKHFSHYKTLIHMLLSSCFWLSRDMWFPTMWYMRPPKAQTSLRIRAVWSEPMLVAWIFYDFMLLIEHHLEFLSLKGGCTGSSESINAKMPHCWKYHVAVQLLKCLHLQAFEPLFSGYISCSFEHGGTFYNLYACFQYTLGV